MYKPKNRASCMLRACRHLTRDLLHALFLGSNGLARHVNDSARTAAGDAAAGAAADHGFHLPHARVGGGMHDW